MKLATTLSLAVILLGLGIFQDLQAQDKTLYDLQFVAVSNSGSTLDVKVQIRSSGADFQLCDANLVFTCTPASNFGVPVILKRFDNFDNTSSTHYKGMTATTLQIGRVSLNIAHGDAPYTTVSTSWMDVAVLRLPFTSANGTFSLSWAKSPTAASTTGNTVLYRYNGANARGTLVPAGTFIDLKGSLNPFSLLAFTARVNGREVLLNWELGADANLSSFDVERSAVSSSATTASWSKIGAVDAGRAVSNSAVRSYAFSDKDIAGANALMYRLKMLGASGDFKYSPIAKVQFNVAIGAPQLLASYPNPFNPAVTIHFTLTNEAPVTITIFDASGKEVTRLYDNEVLQAGDYSKVFNGSELASGKYLLRMVSGDFVATENLILNK
jgi:hypothetical protein